MRTIRLVSKDECEILREEEATRQTTAIERLKGATIIDLKFNGIGILGHTIKEMTLEKNGKLFNVSTEAERFYDCIERYLLITDEEGNDVTEV